MVKYMDYLEKIKNFIVPSGSNNYRSRFLQNDILLYCVVFLLVLKIAASLVSINFPQNIFFADITKSALENFANQTRQSSGLKPLAENQKLNQAAELKAQNMLQNNYFDHISPSGVTPWFWFLKAGYSYKYAGENLAIGFFDSQEVFNAWLNSPSHKANIINPHYTEVGTAVLGGFGQNNSIIVVQEFASPSLAKQPATKTINPKATAVQPKTVAPVSKNVPVATAINEKVLSQSTELQNTIEPSPKTGVNNLPAKIANYAIYNYNKLLQDIIFGVSLVVIGILLTLIFFNFNITFKKELVFRAVLIMFLLSAATLLNRDLMILFVPHQIII